MSMKLGHGKLDMLRGAFLGKRELHYPIKYNIRTKGKIGYVSINFAMEEYKGPHLAYMGIKFIFNRFQSSRHVSMHNLTKYF